MERQPRFEEEIIHNLEMEREREREREKEKVKKAKHF